MSVDEPRAAEAYAVIRKRVDGVFLLDKPIGISSNRALQVVKRAYAALKAGHTGTLDPLATGLLPICLGEATKFAHALLDSTKRYRATVAFGTATSTGDAEGAVERTAAVDFDRDALASALPIFVGEIAQVPPRYSALKLNGRNYYEYAREGVAIERKARSATIHSLELVSWNAPLAEIDVSCSKGTYVRTLAEDIAISLGSCGHLAALRRTGVGPLSVVDAIDLDRLEHAVDAERWAWLAAPESLVKDYPVLELSAHDALAIKRGQRLPAAATPDRCYRCHSPDGFIGLVKVEGEMLSAQRLLRTGDASLAVFASEK
jgi:tRNA pseudouridine55 synthase